MSERVFYSWESDLPNSFSRSSLVARTNNSSISCVVSIDESFELAPTVAAVAWSIIGGGCNAHVFVCDVSIINARSTNRPTPNPNVLIELGYAIKVLGWHRIIMVMNTAFAPVEQLPFDLRLKRVVTR